MPLLSIVIPVYNERSTVLSVIQRVENAVLPEGFSREIIIVNDGSTDGTEKILKTVESKHTIIHQKNKGKGGATRTGFHKAAGDYIIVQDADLEQDPNDFQKLLKPIMHNDADVVFGSRFMGQYSPKTFILNLHYILNRFYTIVCNIFTGYHTTDMWTGYKMYSRKSLNAFLPYLTSDGVAFEPEITILLSKLGFRITDIPISFNPRWYKEGKKMNLQQAIKPLYKMFIFSLRKIPKK